MTREEIINEIKCILSELDNGEDAVSYLNQNDVKWLNENIKALEQQNVLFKSGLLKDCEACRAEQQLWSLDDAREDFMHDVYETLDFLPTNNEANRIIDSFDRVTKCIEQKPILDKVRAEIVELRSKQNVGVLECLDIIDKYRKECENK